ncbi:MAG: hypothetical protein GEU71_17930 [Actinobacteria bacterium]|nr:hypothetical protein [Actinomycetota bacterium]
MNESRWPIGNPGAYSAESEALIKKAHSDQGFGSGSVFIDWISTEDTVPALAWFWLEKFIWGNPWELEVDQRAMQVAVDDLAAGSTQRLTDVQRRLVTIGTKGKILNARETLALHEEATALLRARLYFGAHMESTTSSRAGDVQKLFWTIHRTLTDEQTPFLFLSLDGDRPLIGDAYLKLFVIVGIVEERIWGQSWITLA